MRVVRLKSVVFLGFLMILSACGGGSKASSDGSTLAPTVITKSTADATVAALEIAQKGVSLRTIPLPTSSLSGSLNKSGVTSEGVGKRLLRAIEGFRGVTLADHAKVFRIGTEGGMVFQQSCGSGNINHNGTPDDPTDDSFSLSFNCSGGGFSGSGSLSAGPDGTGNGYLLTFGNYNTTETRNFPDANGRSFSTKQITQRSGSILYNIAPGNCFRGSIFENTAGTFNLTGVDQIDQDGDGIFEIDEAFTFSNFVVTIAEGPLCSEGPITITINGTRSFTDNLNPARNATSVYNNVQLLVTPLTRFINGISTVGHDYEQSGVVTVSSPTACVNGTYSFSTDIPFFIPENTACAVQGRHVMTDTTTLVQSAVIATTTGGLDIDEGNNGSIEQSFANCKEAVICTP